MSRHVDVSRPISDADRDYLVQRGRHDLVRTADLVREGYSYSESLYTSSVREQRVEQESEQDEELPPYHEWTVDELRDELRNRNLSTSGAKVELVARLENDDENG